jgi:hypothetical protein
MQRWRTVAGVIAGTMLVLSSALHSLLGWTVQRAALEAVKAPPDLVVGLGFGWHFAGAAMLSFGVIVLMSIARAARARPVSLRPVLVIGIAYTLYGAWALTASGLEPHFLVFLLPGLLLLAAAWGQP